jgi:hypothetical protein
MTARQYTVRMMFASTAVASAWLGGFFIILDIMIR